MAIDFQTETIIPLRDVPKAQWLPGRRRGARLNLSTCYRWALKGIRGVRLEVINVGSQKCTSKEALSRFFNRLALNSAERPTVVKEPPTRPTLDLSRVQQELERLKL